MFGGRCPFLRAFRLGLRLYDFTRAFAMEMQCSSNHPGSCQNRTRPWTPTDCPGLGLPHLQVVLSSSALKHLLGTRVPKQDCVHRGRCFISAFLGWTYWESWTSWIGSRPSSARGWQLTVEFQAVAVSFSSRIRISKCCQQDTKIVLLPLRFRNSLATESCE